MEDTATYGECVECGLENPLDTNRLCSVCGVPKN
jgi:RNA polymerase-binding transcription factor DksA